MADDTPSAFLTLVTRMCIVTVGFLLVQATMSPSAPTTSHAASPPASAGDSARSLAASAPPPVELKVYFYEFNISSIVTDAEMVRLHGECERRDTDMYSAESKVVIAVRQAAEQNALYEYPEFLNLPPQYARLQVRRELDPELADIFVVPHHGVCIVHKYGYDHKEEVGEKYMFPVLKYIAAMPWFTPETAERHVLVNTHDGARCFFQPRVKEGSPLLSLSSQFTGVQYLGLIFPGNQSSWLLEPWTDCFRLRRDVLVPPVPGVATASDVPGKPLDERNVLAAFHGTVRLDEPKYSYGTRPALHRAYQALSKAERNQSDRYAKLLDYHAGAVPDYKDRLRDAVFYICPGGWKPWSPRLYDAILNEVIPVVIADGIVLPFEGFLDWSQFIVKIPHDEAESVVEILMNITEEEIVRKVETIRRVKQLLWTGVGEQVDQIDSVALMLLELYDRLVGDRLLLPDDSELIALQRIV